MKKVFILVLLSFMIFGLAIAEETPTGQPASGVTQPTSPSPGFAGGVFPFVTGGGNLFGTGGGKTVVIYIWPVRVAAGSLRSS